MLNAKQSPGVGPGLLVWVPVGRIPRGRAAMIGQLEWQGYNLLMEWRHGRVPTDLLVRPPPRISFFLALTLLNLPVSGLPERTPIGGTVQSSR